MTITMFVSIKKKKTFIDNFVHPRELNTIFIEIRFGVSTGGGLASKVVIAKGKPF